MLRGCGQWGKNRQAVCRTGDFWRWSPVGVFWDSYIQNTKGMPQNYYPHLQCFFSFTFTVTMFRQQFVFFSSHLLFIVKLGKIGHVIMVLHKYVDKDIFLQQFFAVFMNLSHCLGHSLGHITWLALVWHKPSAILLIFITVYINHTQAFSDTLSNCLNTEYQN